MCCVYFHGVFFHYRGNNAPGGCLLSKVVGEQGRPRRRLSTTFFCRTTNNYTQPIACENKLSKAVQQKQHTHTHTQTHARGVTADAVAFRDLIGLQVVAVGCVLAVRQGINIAAPVGCQDVRVGQSFTPLHHEIGPAHPAGVVARRAALRERFLPVFVWPATRPSVSGGMQNGTDRWLWHKLNERIKLFIMSFADCI